MKLLKKVFLLSLPLVFTVAPVAFAQAKAAATDGKHHNEWRLYGNADFSSAQSIPNALTFGQHGTAYAAFIAVTSMPSGTGQAVIVMQKHPGVTNNTWQPVGEEPLAKSQSPYQKVGFSIDPVTHTLFAAFSSYGSITLEKFDGSNWNVVATFNNPSDSGIVLPLVISKKEVAYVFSVGDPSMSTSTLSVETLDLKDASASWKPLPTVTLSKSVIIGASFVLSENDTPYLAYESIANYTAPTSTIDVMSYKNGAWQSVGSAISASRVQALAQVQLAFDAKNNLYLAYVDSPSDASSSARYVANAVVDTLSDGQWKSVGNPGFIPGNGISGGLGFVVSAAGTPYITYADASTGEVTAMTFNGTNWVMLGNQSFCYTGADPFDIDPSMFLAINPISSEPYLLYSDKQFGHYLSVDKYHS